MTGSRDHDIDQASPFAEWEETFSPDPAVTPGIRRRVRGLLREWKIADSAADDTLLVVQELVANVIDHARTPFRLIVKMCGSVVKVRIRDYSATPIAPRERDTGAFRGRGLQLVAGLSQRWGCDPEEPGKTVWAAIPV